MFGKHWEKFIDKKIEYTIEAQPLEKYFEQHGKPFEDWLNAACLRGYVGTWELLDNILCLTKIEPFGDTDPRLNLQFIFPNQQKVFANWYSGELKTYSGKYLLPFKDKTDEPLFEFEMHFVFKNGLLQQKTIYKNSMARRRDPKDFMGNDFNTKIIESYKINVGK